MPCTSIAATATHTAAGTEIPARERHTIATPDSATALPITVARVIRAFDPKPGALTTLRGGDVKVFGAKPAPRGESTPPGAVTLIDATGMIIACGHGAVRVSIVQPAGKRRISPDEWARGRGVAVGDRFESAAAAAT